MGGRPRFHALQVTGRSTRHTGKLTVSLVNDPQDRRLTSLWTVPSFGPLTRRSRVLKRCRLLGQRIAGRREFLSLEARNSHPEPT